MSDIIATPDIVSEAKRIIADSLSRQAEMETPYFPNADRKSKNRDSLATILWDIVVNGSALFADGTQLRPESYSDWLATVKYLAQHIDGPVSGDDGVGTNVYKVYVGINMDRL